jgi:hypothetical protein
MHYGDSSPAWGTSVYTFEYGRIWAWGVVGRELVVEDGAECGYEEECGVAILSVSGDGMVW